jgi:Leucine-rich repeat (LRR) protein
MLSLINSLKYIAHRCLEKARELNPLKVKVQHHALQMLQGIKEDFEKTYLLVSKRFRKSDHNSSSIPTIVNTALNQQNLTSYQSISHPLLQSTSFNNRQNLTLGQLTDQLDNWKRSCIVKGDKEKACQRILSAFMNNSTMLNLSCLQLTELPLVIGLLTQLTSLYLQSNKLTALPSTIDNLTQLTNLDLQGNELKALPNEIGNLTQLTNLDLQDNELTALPSTIGNLIQLTKLYLRGNKLTTLPNEIGNLTQLIRLFLDRNKLTALPSTIGNLTQLPSLNLQSNKLVALPNEIGNLTKLTTLDLSNNEDLTSLPLSLGEVATLLTIPIENTRISDESCNAILGRCRAKRDQQDPFLPLLRSWFTAAALPLEEAKFTTTLANREQNIIKEWLRRLEQTRDYQNNQPTLTHLVCSLLTTALEDEAFKEQLINQAEANNSCCEDRSAMAFNEIYVSWKLATLHHISLKDKLTLLIQAAKTLALRGILQKKIDEQEKKTSSPLTESVEIFLYYEATLKKELNLLTAIDNMRYSSIGKREWIKEDTLKEEVRNAYISHLVEIPAFTSLAQQEDSFKKASDLMDEKCREEFEKLGECPALDSLSLEVLGWTSQMGAINEKRKQTSIKIADEWLTKTLNN